MGQELTHHMTALLLVSLLKPRGPVIRYFQTYTHDSRDP